MFISLKEFEHCTALAHRSPGCWLDRLRL